MVEEKQGLRLDPDTTEKISVSSVDRRIFADLMNPLKAELGKGWRKVVGDIADFSLYKKWLDIKQFAEKAKQGDYIGAMGNFIKRGALDTAQVAGIGLFWLAADRIYSQEGAKFLGKIGFPGQVCDLVSGIARTLEKSGQKQTVIASAILMKLLRDSERHPQEGRMSDTELYLRYGRQRVAAFFNRVLPERSGKGN